MGEGRGEKRAKLVDTALPVIQRYGISKITLDDIAQAAGMATTSLYYYFPSKNDLIHAVVATLVDQTILEAREAVTTAPTMEAKLVAIWRTLFVAARRSGFLLDLTSETKPELMRVAGDLVTDFRRRYTELAREAILGGMSRGELAVEDADLAASVLSAGAIGVITMLAGEQDEDLRHIEARLGMLATIALDGLRKR